MTVIITADTDNTGGTDVTVAVPIVETPTYRADYVNQGAPWKTKLEQAKYEITEGDCILHESSEDFLASIRDRIEP